MGGLDDLKVISVLILHKIICCSRSGLVEN